MRNDRTNVRSSPRASWTLRAALGALNAASPALAARFGERLFLTPPRHRAPARERQALASGHRFDVPFQGGRLRAWRFGPDAPEVLLAHGWGGRGGQMFAFVGPLLDAGRSVALFDAPAHGASSGRIASVPLFAAALRAVASKLGTIRGVVAHSMGAPATAFAALEGLTLDAAVFVGPPRNPAAFFDEFCAALAMGKTLAKAVRQRLEARFGARLAEFDLLHWAGRLRLPLLVVHDEDDREVPWHSGEAIARAWEGAALLTTSGLGHRRVLRNPEVVARATAFLMEKLANGGPACEGCPPVGTA